MGSTDCCMDHTNTPDWASAADTAAGTAVDRVLGKGPESALVPALGSVQGRAMDVVLGTGLGLVLGTGLDVVLGTGLDVVLGTALGVGLGTVLGAGQDRGDSLLLGESRRRETRTFGHLTWSPLWFDTGSDPRRKCSGPSPHTNPDLGFARRPVHHLPLGVLLLDRHCHCRLRPPLD